MSVGLAAPCVKFPCKLLSMKATTKKRGRPPGVKETKPRRAPGSTGST